MRALTSCAVLVACPVLASACGSEGSPAPGPAQVSSRASASPVPVTVSPVVGGKHDPFLATITTRAETGVTGKTRSNYTVTAKAVKRASGCVIDRERRFPDSPAGARVRAALDPVRGKGGPEGWCPGRYRGAVIYFKGFACPSEGRCRIPFGFPSRTDTVARFHSA